MDISGVKESVTDKNLGGKVLNLSERIHVEVHQDIIEACHCVKSNTGPKKVNIKMSQNKDADKIRRANWIN